MSFIELFPVCNIAYANCAHNCAKSYIYKGLILTLGIGDGSGRSLVASSLKAEQEQFNAS